MGNPATTTKLKVENALVQSGIISDETLNKAKAEADKAKQPIVQYLLKNKIISDEQLVKANSTITNVPYINLNNAKVDPKILSLLPVDVAERYMAVPLGEIQNRLMVAMLDADNVQAVDFLSNRIGRPLKVYVASESGIRHVMEQYRNSINSEISSAINSEGKAAASEDSVKNPNSIRHLT